MPSMLCMFLLLLSLFFNRISVCQRPAVFFLFSVVVFFWVFSPVVQLVYYCYTTRSIFSLLLLWLFSLYFSSSLLLFFSKILFIIFRWSSKRPQNFSLIDCVFFCCCYFFALLRLRLFRVRNMFVYLARCCSISFFLSCLLSQFHSDDFFSVHIPPWTNL